MAEGELRLLPVMLAAAADSAEGSMFPKKELQKEEKKEKLGYDDEKKMQCVLNEIHTLALYLCKFE